MLQKSSIARNFGKAASRYNHHALLQQQVADKLAKRLQHIALPFAPRILEIGAGTGNLTRKLQTYWPHAEFIVTDLSESMLRIARQYESKYRDRDYFVTMDADLPCFGRSFDLIVSSMSLHWVKSPLDTINNLKNILNPGGVLAFTILTKNTFSPWRRACEKLDLPCGVWDYPSYADLRSINEMMVIEESNTLFFESAQDFVRNLKAIGAATPRAGYRNLSARNLRRILDFANETRPYAVNYDVAYAAFHATKDVERFTNIANASDIPS